MTPRSNFYNKYERNIATIKPSACWTYESLLAKKDCDMASFFDGLDSTSTYVRTHFPDSMIDPPNIPEEGCKQVVLGTFELIAPYFYYNERHDVKPFILLAADHWTEHLNQKYVSCAFKLLLNNQSCEYPIRVLLPNDVEKGLVRANGSPRATLFELCIILQQFKRFSVFEYPLEGQSYRLYFMKYNPGTGGRRRRRTHRK